MATTRENIRQVLEGIQLASLATTTADGAPKVRYVMVGTDDQLTMRIVTYLKSPKVDQIKANPRVHLICGVTAPDTARHWVQVDGQAQISTDDHDRNIMWFSHLEKYFTGPDDPNLAVIRVTPTCIRYHEMEVREPEIWEPGGESNE